MFRFPSRFLKKEAHVVFDDEKTSLRSVAETLASVGYEPLFRMDALDRQPAVKPNRSRLRRIGVAGFCLGNIMLLSFPEYFSDGHLDPGMARFFNGLTLALALPVFFFSASEFFLNAWHGIRQRAVLIDLPIAIGIAAIFVRSTADILTATGPGYFDSMSGLVFFMLVGRWFQDLTFRSLSFDRDYKSYFPIAVTVVHNGAERSVSAYDLIEGDLLMVRHHEIIPADGVLEGGTAHIDYSFVSGESEPVPVVAGDPVYAGGRQTGEAIRIRVTRKVTQSRITQLWQRSNPARSASRFQAMAGTISRWFVAVTFAVALASAAWWFRSDAPRALTAFASVLVIACACALTLSPAFTYGSMLRVLGKRNMFFRDSATLERLADIDTVVFDKTGTLTESRAGAGILNGNALDARDRRLAASLARNSSHPLSRHLAGVLAPDEPDGGWGRVEGFREHAGQGIEGIVDGIQVRIGSHRFTGATDGRTEGTCIRIGDAVKGVYRPEHAFRPGIGLLVGRLKRDGYRLAVLTGDNDRDRDRLQDLFGADTEILFCQSPEDKLRYVERLQARGSKVLMVGDGLNDAGALMRSDAGISVSSGTNNFTPASDGILDADRIGQLGNVLRYSRWGRSVIHAGFGLALAYNIVGLSFAVQGTLSPVIAAILMPVSTVTLVLLAVGAGGLRGTAIFRS